MYRIFFICVLVGSLKSILGDPPAETFPFLLWCYWWQQWVIMLSMKQWCWQIMTELFEWKITTAFNTGKAMCYHNIPLGNCWAIVYVSCSGIHLQNILTSWFLGMAYTLRPCGFGCLLFPQCLIPALWKSECCAHATPDIFRLAIMKLF